MCGQAPGLRSPGTVIPNDIIRLHPIDVMYVREYGEPSEEAFPELEAVVGLKGSRFYGVFDEGAGKYWACVQRREQDDPASFGLRTGTIEGGLYATERLRGDYESLILLIAPLSRPWKSGTPPTPRDPP